MSSCILMFEKIDLKIIFETEAKLFWTFLANFGKWVPVVWKMTKLGKSIQSWKQSIELGKFKVKLER